MAKFHSTAGMFVICGGITAAIIAAINLSATPNVHSPLNVLDISVKAEESKLPAPVWAASATGRVEPKTGEYRLNTVSPGKIVDVLAATHDKVMSGDLLVKIDDEALFAKRVAAVAEVQVRLREREDEPAIGLALVRQNAEDSFDNAERALFAARKDFDAALVRRRDGKGSEDDVKGARNRIAAAETKVEDEYIAYEKLASRAGMPHPTRLETGLTQARSDLSLIETAIERTRIRAPFDGSVLNVWAKVGEVANPSPELALVLFGDLSAMRVRAELEERDLVKVRVGQKVVVRSDAYPGRDFIGRVSKLGGALGAPNIASRGLRRPSDVEVLEVVADLGEQQDLLPGMRVDVFFANNETAQSSSTSEPN